MPEYTGSYKITFLSILDGFGDIFAPFWEPSWDRKSAKMDPKRDVKNGAKKKGIVKPFPHHVDAAAYDIVYVFKKAMEVAKITGDPSKLKEERTAIRDVLGKNQYDLISGKVCFDKNGDAQLPGYILTMKNKQWKLLETHAPLPCS